MASLLYLNPQLPAYCNVLNVADALQVRATWGSNLPSILPSPPDAFNAEGYLILNRSRVDVAGINRTIRDALLAQGVDSNAVAGGERFLPTIVATLDVTGPQQYRFVQTPPHAALKTGDRVKIVGIDAERPTRMLVTTLTSDVDSNGAFTVAEPMPGAAWVGGSYTYTLVGTDVIDPKRVALIDAAAYLQAQPDADPLAQSVIAGNEFDPHLYATLYANAQSLTPQEAVLDYADKYAGGIYRVRVGDDFTPPAYRPDTGGNLSSLVIMRSLVLEPGAQLTFGSRQITGISTIAGSRPTSSNAAHQATVLMTEGAVKGYVDGRVDEVAGLLALMSNELASMSNELASMSNLTPDTITASNVTVSRRLTVGGATFEVDASSNVLSLQGIADLQCSGIITALKFKALSDRRLKRDIVVDDPRTCDTDLSKLLRVDVAQYRFANEQRRQKGLIAQQLEDVYPEAVTAVPRWTMAGSARLRGPRQIELLSDAPVWSAQQDRPVAVRFKSTCSCFCADVQERHVLFHQGDLFLKLLDDEKDLEGCPMHPDEAVVSALLDVKTVDYDYVLVAMLNALKSLAARAGVPDGLS
jgi:hypothetical protein